MSATLATDISPRNKALMLSSILRSGTPRCVSLSTSSSSSIGGASSRLGVDNVSAVADDVRGGVMVGSEETRSSGLSDPFGQPEPFTPGTPFGPQPFRCPALEPPPVPLAEPSSASNVALYVLNSLYRPEPVPLACG